MSAERYDLVAIGSGPAGQKGALAAPKAGKRVAIVDGQGDLGGVCLQTGTIPSKTLREAVLYLSGVRQRAFYGSDYRLKQKIRIEDLQLRVRAVIERQQEVVRDQLERNAIDIVDGMAKFTGPHTLEAVSSDGSVSLEADHVLIACGTRPARREDLPFDHPKVRDADQILQVVEGEISPTGIVIGAGVIGLEYASMMAAAGVKVTVIEARDEIMGFVDRELIKHLVEHLSGLGVVFRLGEEVDRVDPDDAAGGVDVHLASGDVVHAAAVLYAVGRQPNSDRLNLDAIGLPVDKRGRIEVDEHYRTALPHVYAAGDVIGFPALASTSAEQGRVAACHMFELPYRHMPDLLPYGIFTIPEMSMVGKHEQELAEAGVPYVVGRAHFRELARAQITGDLTGMLKLIVDPDEHTLLGVHVVGEGAAEIVHIGLAAMFAGGTIENLRDIVFNYPTMAEAYKVAALDAINQLAV